MLINSLLIKRSFETHDTENKPLIKIIGFLFELKEDLE